MGNHVDTYDDLRELLGYNLDDKGCEADILSYQGNWMT